MRQLTAAAICCGVLFVAGEHARAAVTVGQTFAPDPSFVCPANASLAQGELPAVAPSYKAPNPGVITSWSHRTGPGPTELKLKVLRGEPGGTFSSLTFVGESLVGFFPAEKTTSFPTRIPVKAGDILGLYTKSAALCASTETGGYGLLATPGDHTATSSTYALSSTRKLDLSAVLEPDADGDGFGDETQDLCPADPAIQVACPVASGGASGSGTSSGGGSSPAPSPPPAGPPAPDVDPPDTAFKKLPADRTRKRRVTYSFLAGEAGARFECKLDRKPWKACSSPLTLNALGVGRHVFKARAVDTAGNVDGSAARDTFRVLA